MPTMKKTSVNTPKTVAPSKPVARKAAAKVSSRKGMSGKKMSTDELVEENFAALSGVVTSLGATLELLVQKAESMACHIIATEEILAEIVAANGLNLARVNARIRAKVAAVTDSYVNANQSIDVAAAIASPLPRR